MHRQQTNNTNIKIDTHQTEYHKEWRWIASSKIGCLSLCVMAVCLLFKCYYSYVLLTIINAEQREFQLETCAAAGWGVCALLFGSCFYCLSVVYVLFFFACQCLCLPTNNVNFIERCASQRGEGSVHGCLVNIICSSFSFFFPQNMYCSISLFLFQFEDMSCFSISVEDIRCSDVRGLWTMFSFPQLQRVSLFFLFSCRHALQRVKGWYTQTGRGRDRHRERGRKSDGDKDEREIEAMTRDRQR